MKPSALSILSGGLDSSTATLLAKKDYDISLALTFDYGQRARTQEIAAAKNLCSRSRIPHRVIELPWLASITSTALVNKDHELPHFQSHDLGKNENREQASAKAVWVPNRNGVFLAIAAAHAEAINVDHLIVGFNAEEAATFPDNSEAFMKIYNENLTFSTQNKVKIISPTLHMTKADILQSALEQKIDLGTLWSCYENSAQQCGRCESCARTIRAMKTLNVWNRYETNFS